MLRSPGPLEVLQVVLGTPAPARAGVEAGAGAGAGAGGAGVALAAWCALKGGAAPSARSAMKACMARAVRWTAIRGLLSVCVGGGMALRAREWVCMCAREGVCMCARERVCMWARE
jgi:hypothetical protein